MYIDSKSQVQKNPTKTKFTFGINYYSEVFHGWSFSLNQFALNQCNIFVYLGGAIG